MRSALVISLLAVQFLGTLCITDMERSAVLAKVCMEDSGSSAEVLYNFRHNKITVGAVSDGAKCGMHCYLTKMGLLNAQEELNAAALEAVFSDAQGNKEKLAAIEKCKDAMTSPIKCERAFQFIGCTRSQL